MRACLSLACCLVALAPAPAGPAVETADLRPATIQGWEEYDRAVHARVESELRRATPFLVLDRLSQTVQRQASASLASGTVFITRLPGPTLSGPAPEIRDGLVHHWLGVVRIPGVILEDVLGFVQRYDESARYFDDVIASKTIRRDGDEFEVFLKLRRRKVVTVFYHTIHHVAYRRLDATRAASRSVATRIAELSDAGQPSEREKPVGRDSGYLWRLNSYWRFVEADGGVTVECESISLSRDIPLGLGWMLQGIVEGIARESVEQTLGSIRKGVKQAGRQRVQNESMIPAKYE